jgi:hypothetical protein
MTGEWEMVLELWYVYYVSLLYGVCSLVLGVSKKVKRLFPFLLFTPRI